MALWIIGYPIWDLTDMSLHSVTRFGQLKDYSGFANFSKLIAEPLFFECLIRTLVWTFAVVGGTVLLSIRIALTLADDFIGRQVLRVIIMLPWAVSLTMSGIVWRWALNGQSGMVNATLYDFGAIGGRSPGSPQLAQPFRSRSRSAFSFRSRSRSRYFWAAYLTPREIFEAARIDGASGWQRWRFLTLPLIRPFINIVLVRNFFTSSIPFR